MNNNTISTPIDFVRIDQDEFEQIDFVAMGLAFDVQNSFGRMFNENIYSKLLLARLRKQFESIETEVPVTIRFRTFSKTFHLDLVVDSRAIFELKAAKSIVDVHRMQLRQYLLLTNLKHGKIINFGSGKVQGEYISTTLTSDEQRQLSFDYEAYDAGEEHASNFRDLMTALLKEWGGFLNLDLYYEVSRHLLDGNVIHPISVFDQGQEIGTQKVHLLSESAAYKITAITKEVDAYEAELSRFLRHTELDAIHWVNLDHHRVTFKTIVQGMAE